MAIEPGPAMQVFDTQRVHARLDSAIGTILKDQGFVEDFRLPLIRQLLGVCAIGIATFSHFYFQAHPEYRLGLIASIIAYWILSGIMQYWTYFYDGDVLFVSKGGPHGRNKGIAIKVDSIMPRFTSVHTLKVHLLERPEGQTSFLWPYRAKPVKTLTVSRSICRYFSRDGLLYPPQLETDVRKILSDLKTQ